MSLKNFTFRNFWAVKKEGDLPEWQKLVEMRKAKFSQAFVENIRKEPGNRTGWGYLKFSLVLFASNEYG